MRDDAVLAMATFDDEWLLARKTVQHEQRSYDSSASELRSNTFHRFECILTLRPVDHLLNLSFGN